MEVLKAIVTKLLFKSAFILSDERMHIDVHNELV